MRALVFSSLKAAISLVFIHNMHHQRSGRAQGVSRVFPTAPYPLINPPRPRLCLHLHLLRSGAPRCSLGTLRRRQSPHRLALWPTRPLLLPPQRSARWHPIPDSHSPPWCEHAILERAYSASDSALIPLSCTDSTISPTVCRRSQVTSSQFVKVGGTNHASQQSSAGERSPAVFRGRLGPSSLALLHKRTHKRCHNILDPYRPPQYNRYPLEHARNAFDSVILSLSTTVF